MINISNLYRFTTGTTLKKDIWWAFIARYGNLIGLFRNGFEMENAILTKGRV
jgi:hypothetical protein